MKLTHYSKSNAKIMVRTTKQERLADAGWKPRGFWFSAEDRRGDGWAAWCRAENFRVAHLKYRHRITLMPGARLLHICNADELDSFTRLYRDERHPVNVALKDAFDSSSIRHFLEPNTMAIDWVKVAANYQGIIIAPYLWNRRMAHHTGWYYTWDCASGCIWDSEAVQSVELIRRAHAKSEKLPQNAG